LIQVIGKLSQNKKLIGYDHSIGGADCLQTRLQPFLRKANAA
jgi:hypothetical protein